MEYEENCIHQQKKTQRENDNSDRKYVRYVNIIC